MHIYAFGSVCRGDILPNSDVDLLAIVGGYDSRFSPDDYSIYSYDRIEEIWQEGNPFAWHLASESRLIYSSDEEDFLRSLGKPRPYRNATRDCQKFYSLFKRAKESIETTTETQTFELSIIFLAIRNFATCFSLGYSPQADFSRRAALRIGAHSLDIDKNAFDILERSRILSTRGTGNLLTAQEVTIAAGQFPKIERWMSRLISEVSENANAG